MGSKSMKTRLLVMILSIVTMLIGSTYEVGALGSNNGDKPSQWAREEINRAIEADLIPGRILGNYQKDITREEFAELAISLYETLVGQIAISQGESPFLDTNNPRIAVASELGLIKGIDESKFEPHKNITREEISVILYRTLKKAKPRYDYSQLYAYDFGDYEKIGSWAQEAVNYLYSREILNGVSSDLFSPEAFSTREEAIVLANRMRLKIVLAERESKNGLSASRGSIKREVVTAESRIRPLIEKEMGKPYKWGATGPNSYDCSGFTYAIFKRLGINMPRTSRSQTSVGKFVAKEDLKYGDLVFFAKDGKNINHVGIYVGNGQFVHSPQTGDVVKKTTLKSGYYAKGYFTARRVLFD